MPLQTQEAAELIDPRYQTFWRRFWASNIDMLIFLPISYAMARVPEPGLAPWPTLILSFVDAMLFYVYSIYLHGKYGQTLGKAIMRVVVLDVTEAKVGFRQAALRDSVAIGFSLAFLVPELANVLSGLPPDKAHADGQAYDVVFLFGLVWLAVELCTMLTNRKRRSLHDFIAGTVVIREEFVGTAADSALAPAVVARGKRKGN